jgi:serine/threonine-protein kinase HipA
MLTYCTIQIFLHGEWQPIARFTPTPDQIPLGYAGCGGYLEYDAQYVSEFIMHGDKIYRPRVSLPTPIDFLAIRHDRWPAFLLDLVPTGAGRQGWLSRLNLKDNRTSDWNLLTQGACYPVGWLRVVAGDGDESTGTEEHTVGFTRDEVAVRDENFLEYMIDRGASVTGSSDVQGESPKLLLTEDEEGLLHADGALLDHRARQHWLVKFSRSKNDRERQILQNEGAYLHLANRFQADVHNIKGVELHQGRALFIPRFDRNCTSDHKVLRFGLESFASAAGIAEFGVAAQHEDFCNLITRYSSTPADDLLEYLRRDVLNVCFGNPDNHARNHAFIKRADGDVRLSPLYDFAPMFLSEEGYARVIRWGNGLERMAQPDWTKVGSFVASLEQGPGAEQIAAMFGFIAQQLDSINTYADEVGIQQEVIERRRQVIEENQRILSDGAEKVTKL